MPQGNPPDRGTPFACHSGVGIPPRVPRTPLPPLSARGWNVRTMALQVQATAAKRTKRSPA